MDEIRRKTETYLKERQMSQNCCFVKMILMFLVILGHSVNFWRGDWFTENPIIPSIGLKLFSKWINSFHIYTFTLLSGYIFAYKMSAGGGYTNYYSFLKKKAKRLIVPYIFSALVWVIPISQYFFEWDGITVFKKYVICESPSQLWFLWMLFNVFVIVWPLWKWLSGNVIVGLCLSGGLYCVGVLGFKLMPNIFCIWTAYQYIIFFFIGIRVRISREKQLDWIDKIPWWSWGIVDVFVFLVDMIVEQRIHVRGVSAVSKMITHIVGALMAFVTLEKLAGYIKWEKNKFMVKMSKYSMPIYLFHEQLIYVTIVWFNGKVSPWINAMINFFFAVIGAFAISAVLMCFKTTRFFIGEK